MYARCLYADGFRLEAYKHLITRQYLYVDESANAYVSTPTGMCLVAMVSALEAIRDRLRALGWPRHTTRQDERVKLGQLEARTRHSKSARGKRRRRC